MLTKDTKDCIAIMQTDGFFHTYNIATEAVAKLRKGITGIDLSDCVRLRTFFF